MDGCGGGACMVWGTAEGAVVGRERAERMGRGFSSRDSKVVQSSWELRRGRMDSRSSTGVMDDKGSSQGSSGRSRGWWVIRPVLSFDTCTRIRGARFGLKFTGCTLCEDLVQRLILLLSA